MDTEEGAKRKSRPQRVAPGYGETRYDHPQQHDWRRISPRVG